MNDTLSRRGFLGTIAAVGRRRGRGTARPAAAADLRPPGRRGDERVVKIADHLRDVLLALRRARLGRRTAGSSGSRATPTIRSPRAACARAATPARGCSTTPTGSSTRCSGRASAARASSSASAGTRRWTSWRRGSRRCARCTAPRPSRSSRTAPARTSSPRSCRRTGRRTAPSRRSRSAAARARWATRSRSAAGLGSPEPVDLEHAKLIVLIGSHIGENVFTSQITAFAEGLRAAARSSSSWIRASPPPRRRPTGGSRSGPAPTSRCCSPGSTSSSTRASTTASTSRATRRASTRSPPTSGRSRPSGPRPSRTSPPTRSATRPGPWARRSPPWPLHPGRHATWYGDDTQRARAMAILTALLGSWGRKGGLFLPTPVASGDIEVPAVPRRPPRAAPTARAPLSAGLRGPGRHQRPGRGDAHRPSPTRSRAGSCTGRTCWRASRSASTRSRPSSSST